MPFEAMCAGQSLTIPIEGDIFDLVVVYDIWISGRVGVGIGLLFSLVPAPAIIVGLTITNLPSFC